MSASASSSRSARVWITGVGLVTPLGADAASSMAAVWAGTRGFVPVTLFDSEGCRSTIAAELTSLRVSDVAPRAASARWSRTDCLAVLAAREALAQAGLNAGAAGPLDLVLGGTTAGMFETEHLLAQMHGDAALRQPLDAMLSHPLSATADRMREAVAPFRRAQTVCSACSSGANALLLAASWLRSGRSERVLAGGADGLCRLTYAGFSCLGALSAEPCLPFDARRNGLNLGEAGAFLLLETEQAARARGAHPLAELRGFAVGAEAHHITHPQPTGQTAARVMQDALRRAQLSPADIGYVNAHGTATPLNDAMEAAALALCFGDTRSLPVSSTKSQLGHTLGAAGAVEAVVSVLTLQAGRLPPTSGLEQIDDACPLDHVQTAREQPVKAVMSNSFGFGGSDAVLVLAQPEAFPPLTLPPLSDVVVTAAASFGPLGIAGSVASAGYAQDGPAAPAAPLAFNAAEHLDVARARRIDRAGRLAAAVMQCALAEAPGATPPNMQRSGGIIGAAFGAVDDCAAFVNRVHQKGARLASPAVFPNLLPSSPAAHASIYNHLGGAVWAGSDRASTAESALVTAAELIAAGEAELMLAGGVEVNSSITEAVLGPMLSAVHNVTRSEGAMVLQLEAASAAAARGAEAIAKLSWYQGWRGEDSSALAGAPPPTGRALVMLAADDEAAANALTSSRWASAPRRSCLARTGGHEAAGGMAAAAAFGAIKQGSLDSVLLLSLSEDRGYALVLERVPAEAPA